MFLRSTNRKKEGKSTRYSSVEENQRVSGDKTIRATVLSLGEINDSQQAAWRKTLEVFDEEKQQFTALSLFPEDRPVPADAIDSVQVKHQRDEAGASATVRQLLVGVRAVAAVAD